MKKKVLTAALVTAMTLTMPFTSFAGMMGYWKQDSTGWWWQWLDGVEGRWIKNQWKWIDGNMDGIVECYYFGPDGYLYTDTTTPDGYAVNADGAWTVDGVVQSRAFSLYTDDFSVPMKDVSGAVTDPNAVGKISFNESLIAYRRTADGVAAFPTVLENPRDNYDGLMTEYTTTYNNNPLTVCVLNSIGQITAYFGNASHFVNNIPAQGIEVNAFFDNSGFEDIHKVGGSTGDLDRVFNTPVSSLRILQADFDNHNIHLWIQLTPGTDGEWYVYPDSPAYLV